MTGMIGGSPYATAMRVVTITDAHIRPQSRARGARVPMRVLGGVLTSERSIVRNLFER